MKHAQSFPWMPSIILTLCNPGKFAMPDFFQNDFFLKILSGTPSESQTDLIGPFPIKK